MQTKNILILAHADTWGAVSANKLIQGISDLHNDQHDIHLIVSKATRNQSGGIATGIEALREPRRLKEDALATFFETIDRRKPTQFGSLLTFQQLGQKFCSDSAVHFTSCGGKNGGQEVLKIMEDQELSPDIVLSVDTMAILPPEIVNQYTCYSLHPAPLADIEIAGMQGTLRSLVNEVFYSKTGKRIKPSATTQERYVKGSMFIQAATLDEGPVVAETFTNASPDMSAYELRHAVYNDLVEKMLALLPEILNKENLQKILANTNRTKVKPLSEEQLTEWLSDHQNKIFDPAAFKDIVMQFWPPERTDFEHAYQEAFKVS